MTVTRMKAPQRRQQLLETAVDLFAERGYRGTTTAELARAAGVTEPILYRHFENKLDMFVTLVEEVGAAVIASWEEALKDIEDPRDRLDILLASNPATHKRGRGAYRVIFQAMTEADVDPDIARPLRKHLNQLNKFVTDELKSLQKHGAVRKDVSADLLARFLMDVAVGHGMTSPVGGRGRGGSVSQEQVRELLGELLIA